MSRRPITPDNAIADKAERLLALHDDAATVADEIVDHFGLGYPEAWDAIEMARRRIARGDAA